MTAQIGHNSATNVLDDQATHSFAKDQLKSIVERIEFVENEIKEKQDDRKDIYAEAKSNGLDVAAIRTIVRMRKEDAGDRAERETILDTYLLALGMI
jgi:uncharacterized protein (UPF0335 family)